MGQERVASHILGEVDDNNNNGTINKRLKLSTSAQKKPFSFDGWRAVKTRGTPTT